MGFRHFVIRTATRLALVGWVRNRDDGAVEIWAEGDPKALAALEDEARKGTPASSVREVERYAADATGRYDSFDVLWDRG